MKVIALIVVLGLAAFASACGDDSPTTPTTSTPTTTEFSSRLQPGGSAARSFDATAAGKVDVTLNEAGGAGTRVGIGIGVPSAGVSSCALTSSVIAAAGASPLFSTSVDPGSYCVAIFDPGTLAAAIDFKITLVFP
jgi:hypothetical protein